MTAVAAADPVELPETFPELATSPPTVPSQPEADEPAASPKKWSLKRIAGVLAAAFGLSVLVGLVSSMAGVFLMLAWALAGIGLTFFGVIRLFIAIEGRQRFWLILKMLLPMIGIKLFYVDPALFNRKTGRAMAWMGIGVLLTLGSMFPASWFVTQTRDALAARRTARATGSDVPPSRQGTAPGETGRPASSPVPGQPPVAGMNPGPGFAPGPGFGPGPGVDPAMMGPGPGMGGPLPIRFFYERLEHPTDEIRQRVEDGFARFRFYRQGTIRINESRQSIEFLASYPPGYEETVQMRAAYGEAGVRLRARPPR
ncbi:hypothetical protein [Maioricimonas rarisocia]|uniref:hypothetical protein n=1 Tax=Maioricimonas rarisocia TaxID=2528026 RepID=UPI001E540F1A|nr:hypothetical protein [Maioricimonas rarisocia]